MTILKQIVQEEKLGDKAYKAIREYIVREDLKPGFRLSQSKISEQLGISKTPIKNALIRLEKQGLVNIAPRKGTYIASFSKEDVIEVYDVRAGLECMAIRMGKHNFDKKILARLDKLSQNIVTYIENKNYKKYIQPDAEFHSLLVELSKNSRLIKFYSTLKYQMYMIRKQVADLPGRPEGYYMDHKEIFNALKDGKAESAIKILNKHIGQAKSDLIETI